MGSTLSAIIRIRNISSSDVSSVSVYDLDSFDFGASRPDKSFDKVSIPRESSIERTIDFSFISSNAPFTMKFAFNDGSEDVFRMNSKCVFNEGEANVKHLTKSHRLRFRKTGPRVLEIIIENTQEQKENQKAEFLIDQGCKLMTLAKYNEASLKFMEAALKARETGTKTDLHQHCKNLKTAKDTFDLDQRARSLNQEGLELMKQMRFYDALQKFDEAVNLAQDLETLALIEDNLKIAQDAKMNQDAKKLNQEGLLLRKNNHNEAAVAKFDDALKVAVDRNLINIIKRHKAVTLDRQGKENLEQAWSLEMLAPHEAIHKFSKAKFLFQQAESVKPNIQVQKSIAIIDCKLEGEKYYNTGVQFENKGSRLIDKTVEIVSSLNCQKARKTFEEAWQQFKEAQKKYEEGRSQDENFERCLQLTNQALRGVEKIVKELKEAEMAIAAT